MADFAIDIDPALMLLDDAENRGQSQAGAFADFLGGEERFENLRKIFRRDAAAGVAHAQADEGAGAGLGGCAPAASSNSTAEVSMISCPPLGMASRALTARFISTCSIMPASAWTNSGCMANLNCTWMSSPRMRRSILVMSLMDFVQVQIARLHRLLAAEHEQLAGERGGALGGLANLRGIIPVGSVKDCRRPSTSRTGSG